MFPSPEYPGFLNCSPFLGAQGGDHSPLLTVGVGSCLGTGPGTLPFPGELVRQGLAMGRGETPV